MEQKPLEKARKLASTYYHGENYGRALELFRRCLLLAKSYPEQELIRLRRQMGLPRHSSPESHTVYHPQYSALLGSVAACYERLADFGAAVEYTQRLIKIEPFNVKVFLRLQRLLQRQGNLEAAYAACKRGINNFKKYEQSCGLQNSQRYLQLLERSKKCIGEKLTSRAPPEKKHVIEAGRSQLVRKRQRRVQDTFDFVSGLPPELLPLILNDFSSKELIEVTLVCKLWFQCVFAQPQLFQRFLLNNSTYRQVNKFCEFANGMRHCHRSFELIKYSARTPADELRSLEALLSKLQGVFCRKLLLSVPHCTTSHLSQYMSKNVGLCQSLQELSLVVALRADKPQCEIEMLSHCENLKRLEIIVNSSVVAIGRPSLMRSSSFIEPKLIPTWAVNLKSLLICCDVARVDRFPFITLVSHFPANKLEKLSITGVTFSQSTSQFDWLANFRHLKYLWFENNRGATLAALLHLLRDYPLSNKLERLTFREFSAATKFNLEPPADSFFYSHNFQDLQSLDLMGSSISGLGLLRLVSYLQPSKACRLNIGDCPHIRLDRHQYLNDTSCLPAGPFFKNFPHLQEFIIPQFGALDDNTMKLLVEQAANWGDLRRLDLSMNPTITGVSVYELLRALRKAREVPLEHLSIDGCLSVSHITVNMIRAQGLVKQLDCVYERDTWHRTGINSLKYYSAK